MSHQTSMLADFGVRLAFGLLTILLTTSWRIVPLPFFRTHCLVVLGLLVLAALDASGKTGITSEVAILSASALLAYAAAVSWGLGLPRLAIPSTLLIALGTALWLFLASRESSPPAWAFNTASRLASGFILGATLSAMLLGHHYLTAPTMSIAPLERLVRLMGCGLGARGMIAVLGVILSHARLSGMVPPPVAFDSHLYFLMRWGLGFAGPVLATILAWRTVQIRSTQSATGILYVAITLLLFGELTSLISAGNGGLIG